MEQLQWQLKTMGNDVQVHHVHVHDEVGHDQDLDTSSLCMDDTLWGAGGATSCQCRTDGGH